jgi:CheY-like chemotaxis protein
MLVARHAILCSRNQEVVETIARVFDGAGDRLTICESGLEVLGAVEVVEPDLLILDLQTPGLNGLLLVSAIQRLAPQLAMVAVSTQPVLDARAVSHKGVTFATLSPDSDGGAGEFLAGLAHARGNDGPAGTR